MQGVRGAPDWLEYESLLWELSEIVRNWMKAKRIGRGRNDVLDMVAQLVLERQYKKGRQNFVLVLAERGGGAYGTAFAQMLDDPDVAGHAVKALVKSRTPGYVMSVEKLLLEARAAWVRSAAKKYLSVMKK